MENPMQRESKLLLVGLGNPGRKYAQSRHNMGYGVIEYLSDRYDIHVQKKGFDAMYGTGRIEGCPVVLLQPLTYMNDSGRSVAQALCYYRLSASSLMVFYDDLDLEPSQIRIRKKGSAGSHKGMQSIICTLGTHEFVRVRIGIGRPSPPVPVIDYVLQKIPSDEMDDLKEGMINAGKAAVTALVEGVDAAMNRYNQKRKNTI